MMAHYTCEHVREHVSISIPITTSTDGEIISVPVGNVINKFSLGSKLVGITSDGGTNLARCKDILDITFDKTGVFDLGKTIFVMDSLSHVLANVCKTGVTYMKYDGGRVYTEVTRRNMQC